MAAALPTARLDAGLLARKGQARPAMRAAGGENDLGWNDFGPDGAAPVVLAQRARLADAFPAQRTGGARAAFTLRLDAERHLRLRLASALRGMSAQMLVTQALDTLLDGMHDVDAARLRVAAGEGGGEA